MSKIFKIFSVLAVVILGVAVFNVFLAPYMPASLLKEDNAVESSVVNGVKKSIVALHSVPPYGMRSGLIINESGLVVTLASTIGQKNAISGYLEGDTVSLKNLHVASDGLALLRLGKAGVLPEADFAKEAAIKKGQKVFVVAANSTYQNSWIVSEGKINQVSNEVIVTDIKGNPEISSGPMFNVSGELVGIAYLDEDGRISGVPVSKVRALKDYQ